jgi:hypothetical protein
MVMRLMNDHLQHFLQIWGLPSSRGLKPQYFARCAFLSALLQYFLLTSFICQ